MAELEGFALSPQQARIARQDGDLALSMSLEIAGPLELERLSAALTDCVERHEILRTRLRSQSGSAPLQVIEELTEPVLVGSAAELQAADQPRALLTALTDNLWLLELRFPATCADPRTLELFLDELCRRYNGQALEAEPFQFADFSEWQNQLLEDDKDQTAFWRERPVALPRFPAQAAVPKPSALRRQAVGRCGRSAEQILAGWLGLLLRMNERACSVHCLLDGRIDAQFAQGLGPYAAHVAITAAPRPDLTLALLAHLCREARDEAASLLEYLGHDLAASPSGSFDFLVWPPAPERTLGQARLRLRERRCRYHAFAAQLVLEPEDDGFRLELDWDAGRLDEAEVRQLAQTLIVLLRAEDDRQALAELELLEAQQRHQLLVAFNRTARDFAAERSVHARFEAQVEATPGALALVHGDERLTYAALDAWANAIAADLHARGLKAETPVALAIGLVPALPAAILGVLKCGACYVPLDPDHPRQRMFQALADCGAPILLTAANGQWDDCPVPVRDVDTLRAATAAAPTTVVAASQLAYLMYTSGSTGTPKAVAISHRALGHYLDWANGTYGPALDAPAFSTPAADLGLTSLLGPLLAGRTVTLLEGALEQLPEIHRAAGFGLIKLTPSHLKVLSAYLDPHQPDLGAGCLVVGGEALFEEDLRPWRTCFPNWRIINEYGPSETTVGCCVAQAVGEQGAVAIGRPIANTQLYVLDPRLQPLPPGLPGELYIGGVGLARGYYGRPALTAARFVPDPFADQPGLRLYRSGDRVRFLCGENTRLDYLGRVDDQVKIRGFRIELGEVEAALRRIAGLGEVFVDLVEQRLVAYFCARGQVFVDQLRAELAACLPEPMIPSFFVPLERLPLTANGKVDRARLPKPDHNRPQLSSAFVAPNTALELTLASLWRDALGQTSIGVHDNFFSLGGDSIRSVRLAAAAVKQGLPLTVQDIFRLPTITAQAQFLESENAAAEASLLASVEGMSDEEAAALLAELEAGGAP